MKPLSSCSLFGAYKAVIGITDAVVLQHSVIGCHWGTLNFHYAQHPYDIRQASTVVYEEDVIRGGEKILRKGIQETIASYPNCNAIFVISGCVPNIIADDVEGIITGVETDKKILHIIAPGYAGGIDVGMENALLSLSKLMQPMPKSETRTINILGISADDPYADNDVNTLRQLLGDTVNISCSLHNCTTEQIAHMSSAHLNVVFGYGKNLARKMEREYGVPYVEVDYPYGVQGMIDFLQMLERQLQVSFSEQIADLEAQGRELVRKAAYYLSVLYQLPVALVGDLCHMPGMKSFLTKEMGMRIVYSANNDKADMDTLVSELERENPTLLLGSSFERKVADQSNLPFVRYTYPVFDEMCFGNFSFLGVEGTANLLEKIVNAALQAQYKTNGLFGELHCREE